LILSYQSKDMDLTNFAFLQKFQKTKKMEEELWAGSKNGSATCNASGPDLVGVGNNRPRGARDTSEQSWAKAHLAPDLHKMEQKG
jgi:hypothetical protein